MAALTVAAQRANAAASWSSDGNSTGAEISSTWRR